MGEQKYLTSLQCTFADTGLIVAVYPYDGVQALPMHRSALNRLKERDFSNIPSHVFPFAFIFGSTSAFSLGVNESWTEVLYDGSQEVFLADTTGEASDPIHPHCRICAQRVDLETVRLRCSATAELSNHLQSFV